MANLVAGTRKRQLFFYGTEHQLEHLHTVCPGLAEEAFIQHVHEVRAEPILHGAGDYAKGWRQIGHVFDPEFDPS